MTPRRAHIRHLPWLLMILWAFTRDTSWLPRARSRLTDTWLMLRVIRRGWVRMVTRDARPAGFIIRDGAIVHALFIHPDTRGQGVGRVLLNEAKAHTARLDLRVLHANKQARAFYLSQGFSEAMCGLGADNDENLPDVQMVWQDREGIHP